MASSFLTFPWRSRRPASSRKHVSSSSLNREGPPPMRRFSSTTSARDFSSSSNTTIGAPHPGDDDLDEIPAPSSSAGGIRSEEFYTLRIPKQPPQTPEGLRPRRGRDLVRKELGLLGLLPPKPSASADDIDTLSFVQDDDNDEEDDRSDTSSRPASYSVLPPRSANNSWCSSSSATTGHLLSQLQRQQQQQPSPPQVASSPPVSTNSFYGPSNDGTVAASPQLYPGQARTAVGAIVALQQHAQQHQLPWNSKQDVSSSSSLASRSLNSDLQQREPEEEQPRQRLLPTPHDDDEDVDWHYHHTDNVDGVDSPPRNSSHLRETSLPDDSIDENEQPVYYSLDDPITNNRSPMRPVRRQRKSTTTRAAAAAAAVSARDSSVEYSPISTGSSLLGSPSSRAGLRSRFLVPRNEDEARHILPTGAGATSSNGRSSYDFGPLAGATLLATDDPNNLSAMSEHASVSRRIILGSTNGNDENDEAYDKYLIESSRELQSYGPPLDGALRKGKTQNQRRDKESLLIAALERLRDDLPVIADLEASAAMGVDDLWLVKTPLNERGILTGFSKNQRTQISDSFAILLKSMQLAQPEEFVLSSPSEVPTYAETHDDLYDALQFCRRLVEHEKSDPLGGQWKFRARAALGLLPPESPEVRGGDTSLFSLPDSETPMTSNVSLTTTITSAVLTPQRQQQQPSASRHHPGQQTQPHHRPAWNGLAVRRTMELFTTRLQQMTAACVELLHHCSTKKSPASTTGENHNHKKTKQEWSLGTKESLRITETIKRTYLQLLKMDRQDLKAVVDSFELQEDEQGENMPPPPTSIHHTTTNNHHHRRAHHAAAVACVMTLPPPPPLLFSQQQQAQAQQLLQVPSATAPSANHDDDDDDDDDDVFIVDDLRRQMGSVDYDDAVELREGAPE